MTLDSNGNGMANAAVYGYDLTNGHDLWLFDHSQWCFCCTPQTTSNHNNQFCQGVNLSHVMTKDSNDKWHGIWYCAWYDLTTNRHCLWFLFIFFSSLKSLYRLVMLTELAFQTLIMRMKNSHCENMHHLQWETRLCIIHSCMDTGEFTFQTWFKFKNSFCLLWLDHNSTQICMLLFTYCNSLILLVRQQQYVLNSESVILCDGTHSHNRTLDSSRGLLYSFVLTEWLAFMIRAGCLNSAKD